MPTQQQLLGEILAKIDKLEVSQERLMRILEGNGTSGIVERMRLVEHKVDCMVEEKQESEKERRAFWNKVLIIVISTFITNIGVWISAVYKIWSFTK
jgi:hypothetical protein